MELIDVCDIFKSHLSCPVCRIKSLELFRANNFALGYNDLLNRKARGITDNIIEKSPVIFRCKSCGAEFPIWWVDGFPYPLRNKFSEKEFIERLKKYRKG